MQKVALLAALPQLQAQIFMASNELGGIAPLGQLSREFVDLAGWMNQVVVGCGLGGCRFSYG